MHPGMMAWWKWGRGQRQAHWGAPAECGPSGGCGPSVCGPSERGRGWGHDHVAAGGPDSEGDFGGGAFGVRRPLRFLAYKLELDERQVAELARVLDDLKTERAQAAVDHRRTVSGLAEVVAAEAFDAEKAGEVAAHRVKSAERLREAIVKALGRIHAVLSAGQRERFAYLIRTGALSL